MEPKDYIVKDIQGEYAILADLKDESELFIAMALLPVDTTINTKLHYENLMYEIIE